MIKYPEITELYFGSSLEFILLDKDLNILDSKKIQYEKINNFMSTDLYIPSIKEHKQVIKFYGFPTDEDRKRLAGYITKNKNENIFSIQIGTRFADAQNILISKGYKKEDNDFIKGVIKINLHCRKDTEIIDSLDISLKSKYLGNKLY